MNINNFIAETQKAEKTEKEIALTKSKKTTAFKKNGI